MSALDTAKEIVRMTSTAGLSKDVIDLLEKKLAIITGELADATRKSGLLETRILKLEAENANLKAKIQNLEPIEQRLTDEDMNVLRFMDVAGDTIYPRQIAAKFGIIESRAIWLLNRLTELGQIWERPILPHSYYIMQKGRDAIHNPPA